MPMNAAGTTVAFMYECCGCACCMHAVARLRHTQAMQKANEHTPGRIAMRPSNTKRLPSHSSVSFCFM